MALGSFLASAGRVGQSIRAEEAAMRQARQQQLALEELNRQNEFRRLQLEAPPVELPAQGMMLGAPMQVSEPEITPAGVTGAGLLPATPAATAPGKPAPRAPAAQGGISMLIRGQRIPVYSSKDPNVISGAASNTWLGAEYGFQQIDPNASNFEQRQLRQRNEDILSNRLSGVANEIDPMRGSTISTLVNAVRRDFATQSDKAALDLIQSSNNWYRSNNAREYFRRNPQMLPYAEKEPVKFYSRLMRYNTAPDSGQWYFRTGGARTPARAGSAAGLAATSSYANVPFSQVKGMIIGREGPAALGGYNALAYNTANGRNAAGVPQPPKPLTSMTIKEVLDFQRGPMRAATKGYRGANDVGSTGAGAYQFESNTLAENARLTFGDAWMNAPFTPENQDRIAETLYNRVRGNSSQLANTWFVFKGGAAPAPAAGGAAQLAAAPATPVPVRIDPSNFYMANPNATSRDTRIALQNRQELARLGEMYRRAGMGNEYTAARLKVVELDNSLIYLQGMQGLQELALANDPRRLAAVWSDYAGVPVQLQPQTDGTLNIVVNGRITQRGIPRATVIDAARSAFDKQYVQTQSEAATEMAAEAFKSQLRMTEEAAKTAATFAADVQLELLKGDSEKALELIKQMDPNGKITMLPDGSGQAILQVQGQTLLIDKGGVQIEGAPEGMVSGPSARPIAGVQQRVVGVGTGG